MKRKLPIILSIVILVPFFVYSLKKKQETAKTVSFIDHSIDRAVHEVEHPETAVVAGTSATPVPTVFPQIKVLDEIFKSKNDNDPRLDRDLKNLSPEVKAALRKKYQDTKPEMRNERGTIAFILGREVKEGRGHPDDVEFLKNVLLEKPCLSLSDCSKPANNQSPEEQHLEGMHETTAHYPQLMTMRYLKQALEDDRGVLSISQRNEITAALEMAAKNSPNSRVVEETRAILNSQPK